MDRLAYTIFAAQLDRVSAIDALRSCHAGQIDVCGGEFEWSSVRLVGERGQIEFNALFRSVPRDQATRIVLGMHNWVRNAKASSEDLRARVADHVIESRALIGIVASMDVLPGSAEFTCIQAVAKAIGGIIFTGSVILNAEGNVLLPS